LTCTYAVTFEYPTRPPDTHRGTVTGGKSWVCVQRATRDAHKALKPIGWSSMVCVLLDRAGESDREDAEATPDEAPDV
jgi:hypothetical protein